MECGSLLPLFKCANLPRVIICVPREPCHAKSGSNLPHSIRLSSGDDEQGEACGHERETQEAALYPEQALETPVPPEARSEPLGGKIFRDRRVATFCAEVASGSFS